jgi:hypothetical protein
MLDRFDTQYKRFFGLGERVDLSTAFLPLMLLPSSLIPLARCSGTGGHSHASAISLLFQPVTTNLVGLGIWCSLAVLTVVPHVRPSPYHSRRSCAVSVIRTLTPAILPPDESVFKSIKMGQYRATTRRKG